MIENLTNFAFTTIFVPVLLLVLKSLLGEEISYWITLLHCFFYRPFDVDNNVDTHDWAMIYNQGNGEWECCSLTFHFGWQKAGNGVFIYHYDKDWNLRFTEQVEFGRWKKIYKAKIENPQLIDGLKDKMKEMVLDYYDKKLTQ